MSVDLNKIPRWALVTALTLTLPVAGYALSYHVKTDEKQSADIQELLRVTTQLAEATANLKDAQKSQTEEMKELRQALLSRYRQTRADSK